MTFHSPLSKLTFLLPLLLLFGGILLVVSGETAASPQGGYLTAVQLTDHALTGEDAPVISMQLGTSRNAGHIIWQEQNLSNTNSDLYYRSVPNGTTQRISDIADSNGNVITFPLMKISTAGVPHVVWEEDTGTAESRDLYYWNPNDGTQRLTDRTATEGDVLFNSKQMWLEPSGAVHIVWQELDSSQTENSYFYWNSISETILQMPGFEAGIVKNGVLHVVWEATQTGPVQYWNTSSQTPVALPNSTAGGDIAVQQKGIFASDSGEITIFFGKNFVGDAPTDCLVKWTSTSQSSSTLVTGQRCFSLNNVLQDASGAFHAFGVDSTASPFAFLPFYWSSSLTNAIYFDASSAGTGLAIPSASLRLAENGKAHILWQDDHNFYYWNPTDQQIINLSEPLGSGSFISPPQFSFLDAAGELNLIWTEAGHPNYWNSDEQVTSNLLTRLNMSNISYQVLSSYSSSTPVYLFQGIPNVGNAGLFYWDIASDNLVPVWEGIINPSIVQYLETESGEVFIGWLENSTTLFHLYSASQGVSSMNTTSASENSIIFNIAKDDFNNLYVTWTETSDTAGKGTDYFAAWSTDFVEGTADVYLPLILR